MFTLEFENVTKSHGHEVVVDDLTFTVQPGRVTGFLGAQRSREVHGDEDPARPRQSRPRSRHDRWA